MCEKTEQNLSRPEITIVRKAIRSLCLQACQYRRMDCPTTLQNDKLPRCYSSPFKIESLILKIKGDSDSTTPEDILRISNLLNTLPLMTTDDLEERAKLLAKHQVHFPSLKELSERRKAQNGEDSN